MGRNSYRKIIKKGGLFMIYERDVLILNDEQKILEKAFNWWVKNDVIYGRNIKSLYL